MSSKQEMLDCVQREIKMRERVYPLWCAAGKMTVAKAQYEIMCMRDVLAVLVELEAAERLI